VAKQIGTWLAIIPCIAVIVIAGTACAQDRSSPYVSTPATPDLVLASGQGRLGVIDSVNLGKSQPARGTAESYGQTQSIGQLASGLRRLPPVEPRENEARLPSQTQTASAVDGTWKEEGRYIIIDLNGQQLRLEKSADSETEPPARNATASGGEVYGRLSSRQGSPIVDCKVALLPLKKTWNSYAVDGSVKPLIVHTDSNGVYHFEDVRPGPYKLSWLPAGTRQWIRRIEFRPDVRVKSNAVAHAKEIHHSLRTVN